MNRETVTVLRQGYMRACLGANRDSSSLLWLVFFVLSFPLFTLRDIEREREKRKSEIKRREREREVQQGGNSGA